MNDSTKNQDKHNLQGGDLANKSSAVDTDDEVVQYDGMPEGEPEITAKATKQNHSQSKSKGFKNADTQQMQMQMKAQQMQARQKGENEQIEELLDLDLDNELLFNAKKDKSRDARRSSIILFNIVFWGIISLISSVVITWNISSYIFSAKCDSQYVLQRYRMSSEIDMMKRDVYFDGANSKTQIRKLTIENNKLKDDIALLKMKNEVGIKDN